MIRVGLGVRRAKGHGLILDFAVKATQQTKQRTPTWDSESKEARRLFRAKKVLHIPEQPVTPA